MSSFPTQATSRPTAEAASGRLARLGAFCARHALWVIAGWLVVLVAALGGRHVVGATYSDQVSLPGSQSSAGASLLTASDPALAKPNGKVVFHVPGGTVADHGAAVDAAVGDLGKLPHVVAASSLVTSADGATAYTTVSFDAQLKTLGHGYTAQLDAATAPARADGVQVAYGGDLDQVVRAPADDKASEVAGIVAALLILLLAFGSVVAALLPLGAALVAVGAGIGVVGIVGGVVAFATAATTLATMIGLGVGIDYALFLTTRFRQDLMDGHGPVEAAARTTSRSGHAVLIAGTTVAIAMLSLYACGLTFIGKLGLAATIAVVVTATAAVTLVPAALGLVGRRIDKVAVRTPVAETGGDDDRWHRYAELVARRPWRFLAAGGVVLVVCALPLFSLRLGHVDDGADKVGSTTRTAFDWISQGGGPGFGPGANGTFTVVTDVRAATVPVSQIESSLTSGLQNTGSVARFTPVGPTPDGKLLVSTVTPVDRPQSASTGRLFEVLTKDTLPAAVHGTGARTYVTGSTAGQLDFRDTVKSRLPIIIGIVLVAAFLLLMTVFRSVLIPLKAVSLNLLTTGASYGILVAVFQWGWGDGLLGLSGPVPIESYVPMMMFAIVFGLSMDYEIFLLSRIAETWHQGRDNTRAVGQGLATTGRVISSAAFIMTAVFLSFTASPTVVIKMLALGLAVSVVLDATIVRLVLVPSTMTLMGKGNWWLPKWLEKVLPHVSA